MPRAGIEPARYFYRGILSPLSNANYLFLLEYTGAIWGYFDPFGAILGLGVIGPDPGPRPDTWQIHRVIQVQLIFAIPVFYPDTRKPQQYCVTDDLVIMNIRYCEVRRVTGSVSRVFIRIKLGATPAATLDNRYRHGQNVPQVLDF